MSIVEKSIDKLNSVSEDYTVLYDKVKKNRTQVQETLPDWIVNATKVHDSFENSKKLSKVSEISKDIRTILKTSIKKLFPVQYTVIPAILRSNESNGIFLPHDICVCAPTGSGKTLAYVTPILQFLTETNGDGARGPRALIVLPVRDLASQVFNVINGLSKSLSIRCALINGHKSYHDERKDLIQESNGAIVNKVDVVVCTPGRLVDHVRNTKEMDWCQIRYLVIDEADRILDEHKHDWYLTLSRKIDAARGLTDVKKLRNIASCFAASDGYFLQKILLSATLTREPHLLEHFDLHYPQLYVVGGGGGGHRMTEARETGGSTAEDLTVNYAAPEGLTDFFVGCSKDYSKVLFIVDQVRRLGTTRMLVFVNTRDNASRLCALLKEFAGVRTEYLSCEIHPSNRGRLLARFEAGDIDVLVTVDSLSRGMDIRSVACVVQYDVAKDVHTHIHRVGRTARAGQTGVSYVLCADKEVKYVRASMAKCHRAIRKHKFSPEKCYKYMTEYNAALERLRSRSRAAAIKTDPNYGDSGGRRTTDEDHEAQPMSM